MTQKRKTIIARVLFLSAVLGGLSLFAISSASPAKEAKPADAAKPEEDRKNWPKTLDEAAGRTLATMSEATKKALRGTALPDLIKFHDSLGATIRNTFGLRRGNRALMQDCNAKNPDEASLVIIEEVWARLQKERK